MKNTMNKIYKTRIIAVLFLLAMTGYVNSQTPVGTGFNFQGELSDSGSLATGIYDIQVVPYMVETGGIANINDLREFLNVPVSNGLFNIENIDFGDMIYSNSDTIWLEISMRKSSVGGNFSILSPRQRIKAIPYAVQSEFANEANTASNLSVNGSTNDVLVYNGSNWVSSGDKIRVSSVGVSVGTSSIPPSNGLRVGGDTHFDGNLTQSVNATGLPKYMANVSCLNGSNSITSTDFTGGNATASVTSHISFVGYCFVTFPISLTNRYYLVTTQDNNGAYTSCKVDGGDSTRLACQVVDRQGEYEYGSYMIMVY